MTKPTSQKVLGPWMLTALVTGNMIGSGIFLLPSALAQFGSISLLGWVVTSAGALCLALVFAQLSAWSPITGGPYAYCHKVYGNFAGFQIAYSYWIALWVGNAAIIVACVSYLSFFFPTLATHPWMNFFLSAGILWCFTLINIIGIKEAGVVQLITTILKLCPLLLIGLIGLPFVNTSYLHPFNTSHTSNLTALQGAVALTLWAFIGLESATVPAENVINPQRNIPRATILGTLITSVIYISCSFVIMGVIPNHLLAQSNSPFALAAGMLFGHWASLLIAIGAVISCLGTLNGWVLLQAQIPMAAARDGLFPRIFTKQNKNGAPWVGLFVSSMLITGLLALNVNASLIKEFQSITLLAVLANLIAYFYTAIAYFQIQREQRQLKKSTLLKMSAIAILAAIYSFWALIGAGVEIVFLGVLLFFSSVPFYLLQTLRQGDELQ